MDTRQTLRPVAELVAQGSSHYPNESADYRKARNALLAEEIELRRHIERVAEMRRQLPPGGAIVKDYRFEGEDGPVGFADLFGDKETLVAYSYMYGPQRKAPCPMCTSLMSAWDGEARDVEQRIAFAMIARSPIERLRAFTIRLHEWCEPLGTRRKRGAHNRVPISEFSLQLALKDPERLVVAMAPISRMLNEVVKGAVDAGAIRVTNTQRAAMLIQQTVMYGWLMNRLVPNPKARVTAEDAWAFCLHGLGG